MKAEFHQILSRLRKEKRLSQRKVAQELGISQALLSHYENGIREPGLPFVDRACSYYGVTADYLLGRSDYLLTKESLKFLKEICASMSVQAQHLNTLEHFLASTLQEASDASQEQDNKKKESL